MSYFRFISLFAITWVIIAQSIMSPGISFAQPVDSALPTNIKVPGSLEEAKEQSEAVGKEFASGLPGIVQRIWHQEVIPAWQAMWNWIVSLWNNYVFAFIQDIWDSLRSLVGQEVEKRKPIIEQELQKEKEELKEDIKTQSKRTGQNLWQRFKSLFQ